MNEEFSVYCNGHLCSEQIAHEIIDAKLSSRKIQVTGKDGVIIFSTLIFQRKDIKTIWIMKVASDNLCTCKRVTFDELTKKLNRDCSY